jgi:uncharacterized protein with LGFP repeats
MPRARVQLSDVQQQSQRFFTTTNADGSYQADQIPVGVYRIEAQTGWGWSEPLQVQVMPDQIAAGDLIVITPIDQKAQALGSEFLGKPLSAEQIASDDAGRFREFERAVIYWRPDLGAHEMHGDIRGQWEILGGLLKSKLGYPVTDELPMSDRRGRYNDFESGGIYWTRDTGAHELRDRIREAWLNKYQSELGYPITDQRESPDRRQVFNIFEKGCMAWNPTTDEISINLGQYDPKSTDCAPIITIF